LQSSLGHSKPPQPSEPNRTKPESEVSPEDFGQPVCNVFSNPYAKVKWRFPRQVLPLTRVFRGNVREYGLLHLKLISKFSYEFTEIQFYEFSFSTCAVMVVLVNSKAVSVSQCPVSRVDSMGRRNTRPKSTYRGLNCQ
jgi:hypothetical protein